MNGFYLTLNKRNMCLLCLMDIAFLLQGRNCSVKMESVFLVEFFSMKILLLGTMHIHFYVNISFAAFLFIFSP
ncbi:hypothetical protein CICLE_v10007203mg [Citrus x clementina]|uniref:Uncharacterized protein n=1 Tax=Citrus clementina TaxID=85681 RepID=V4U4U9_CITCL|nr:hypothetical protein CICLE_v10007203mg [Citrus x clementina]